MAAVFEQELIYPSDIDIDPGRRATDPEKVKALAASMEKIGLLTPISVWTPDNGETVRLIAGRHRLEAALLLKWPTIRCVMLELSETDRRLWEISENLHRAELTKVEYAEQLDEWRRLTLEKKQEAPNAQLAHWGGKPDRGHSATAKEFSIGRRDVERAEKIAALDPAAKETARELHLDDNQAALLKAAKEPTAERQVEALQEHAAALAALSPVAPPPPPIAQPAPPKPPEPARPSPTAIRDQGKAALRDWLRHAPLDTLEHLPGILSGDRERILRLSYDNRKTIADQIVTVLGVQPAGSRRAA